MVHGGGVINNTDSTKAIDIGTRVGVSGIVVDVRQCQLAELFDESKIDRICVRCLLVEGEAYYDQATLILTGR
jgi:hypothetical protein